MFAELTGGAFVAHTIFNTHNPHFLGSGTKPVHLIFKNLNLSKEAILPFVKTWLFLYCDEY